MIPVFAHMKHSIRNYAWDQEVLQDVLAHMTFIHTDDPAAA